jgi:hypothetical protein
MLIQKWAYPIGYWNVLLLNFTSMKLVFIKVVALGRAHKINFPVTDFQFYKSSVVNVQSETSWEECIT